MFQKYTLDIISQHEQFKNKTLRKYSVEGIETVGAWGNEPFEVRFKNHTGGKLQVKLSLDGTDILTGQPASTEPSKEMWVVNPYATLTLKAWPETTNGGSQFVFTSADKSVALHTHGDVSNRGIIAAAVFTEGHVEPQRVYPYGRRSMDYTLGGTKGSSTFDLIGEDNLGSVINSADTRSRSLQSKAAIGAGSQVSQHITYVSGLIKPVLSETVRVKYVWWDDLVADLKDSNQYDQHPSGFPADSPVMSVGNTPKVDTAHHNTVVRRLPNEFARV